MRRRSIWLAVTGPLASLALTIPSSAVAAATVSATGDNTTPSAARQVASAEAGSISVNVYVYYNPSLDGQEVQLSSYGSTTCGSISSYSWDFGDGSATSTSNSWVYHTWYTGGTTKYYTVRLTTTDTCGGSVTTSFTQTVKPDVPPSISVSFSKDSTNPLKVFADPSATTDTDGGVPDPTGPYYYSWNWGDGKYSNSYASSSGGLASHTYATAGSYTVTVDAYDENWNSSRKTYTVCAGANCPQMIENTSSALTYNGTWARDSCTSSRCSPNRSVSYSKTSGNSAIVRFTGTQIKWIGPKGPLLGKAGVYIDGVLKTTVNLYRDSYLDGMTLYSSPTLTRGAHTLKVKLTLSKRVNIDNFTYLP